MMIPPSNVRIYETPLNIYWIGDDGIYYSISKPVERSVEDSRKLLEVYMDLAKKENRKLYILSDISDVKPIPKEVREFVTAEMSKFVAAMALISSSSVGIGTGNIFEMLSKTPYPVATFGTKEEAVIWLQQQKRLDAARKKND